MTLASLNVPEVSEALCEELLVLKVRVLPLGQKVLFKIKKQTTTVGTFDQCNVISHFGGGGSLECVKLGVGVHVWRVQCESWGVEILGCKNKVGICRSWAQLLQRADMDQHLPFC